MANGKLRSDLALAYHFSCPHCIINKKMPFDQGITPLHQYGDTLHTPHVANISTHVVIRQLMAALCYANKLQ